MGTTFYAPGQYVLGEIPAKRLDGNSVFREDGTNAIVITRQSLLEGMGYECDPV